MGWKDVFSGFGHVGTLLADPAWLVTQFDIYSAASKFVEEERDKYQGAFIDLLEFFSPSTPRPLGEEARHASERSIPVPVLRGAGYVAKFHLETHTIHKPFYLVFPNMDAGVEAAMLRRWASHFYQDDLNLAAENARLPRVLGSVAIDSAWAYKTEPASRVYTKNVKFGDDPEVDKFYGIQESFFEKVS